MAEDLIMSEESTDSDTALGCSQPAPMSRISTASDIRDSQVTLQSIEVRGPDDFAPALAALTTERPDALMTLAEPLTIMYRRQIADFAVTHRLPMMSQLKEFAEAGGLMTYGTSLPGLFQHAAYYVDRILKGAKPADLPVEQPTKFELIINLKTAQALGITIPPTLLFQADEVIR